ncbi:hypothetical protein ACIPI6_31395 [Pseudomonas protegens]|uniref:hypothetical protein n=1 Tax=Pseudomonas protegens TaxID=380021 RepID=UPI00383003E3
MSASEFKLYREEDGEVLIDSNFISYGLVKSGLVKKIGQWNVPYRDGDGPWPDYSYMMDMWEARVRGVIPVLFMHGRAILISINKGALNDEWVYIFAGCTPETRFYAYDYMREANDQPVRFRLWDEEGNISFNSKQWPLNVFDTVQLPGNSQSNSFSPYDGGNSDGTYVKRYSNERLYAGYIPFNRSAECGCVNNSEVIQAHAEYLITCIEGGWGIKGAGVAGFHSDPNVYPFNDAISTGRLDFWQRVYLAAIPKLVVVDVTDLPFPFDFYD